MSYVNWQAWFEPVSLKGTGAPPGRHGGRVLLGYSARNPNSQVSVDLKTINPKAIFNFLKFKKPWIRDWQRKKSNIKEREYLLIILVLVFNISISYIYILIRGRDGFFRFWDGFGVF